MCDPTPSGYGDSSFSTSPLLLPIALLRSTLWTNSFLLGDPPASRLSEELNTGANLSFPEPTPTVVAICPH